MSRRAPRLGGSWAGTGSSRRSTFHMQACFRHSNPREDEGRRGRTNLAVVHAAHQASVRRAGGRSALYLQSVFRAKQTTADLHRRSSWAKLKH